MSCFHLLLVPGCAQPSSLCPLFQHLGVCLVQKFNELSGHVSCMSCKERGRRARINGESDFEKEEYAVGMGLVDPAGSALRGAG